MKLFSLALLLLFLCSSFLIVASTQTTHATGTPDAYNNAISGTYFLQNNTGLWASSSSVTSSEYTAGISVLVYPNEHTLVDVLVQVSHEGIYQSGWTLTNAIANSKVLINITGLVTNQNMTYSVGGDAGSYWSLEYDYPSTLASGPNATWVPITSTYYIVTVQLQIYYLSAWHNAESWNITVFSGTPNYFYVIHGPYSESGTVYNGIVDVTITYETQTPYNFSLSGISGSAETENVSSIYPATLMTWNITANYGHVRMYAFHASSTSDEVWLYVPSDTDIVEQYSITITDFAGLSNATVETDRNILGYNKVLERQNLDVNNPMVFWLIWYQQYTLKVVSDQGTFAWALLADSTLSKTFIITRDMISQADVSQNCTVQATQINSTALSVYVYDGSHLASWITSEVYMHNTTGYYLFYSLNDTGYLQNYTLTTLNSTANYLVRVYVMQNGEISFWQIGLQAPPPSTNPWHGLFDVFGDWPFLAENAFGMFIVVMFFAIGSWSDTEFFLGAGIVIAGVLVAIGWLSIPYAGITMALIVVVFMYFHKGKQEQREI